MARTLLQEAVADAKQLRNVAILNAKAQIEEAFTPHLASMFSARLRNEVENVNEDNDGSSEIGSGAVTVKNPGPKNPSAKTSDSSHVENPGLEIDTFDNPATALKEDDQFGLGDDDAQLDIDTPEGEVDIDVDGEGDGFGAADADQFGGDEFGGDPAVGPGADAGEPDELDLDAIIRELELDLDGGADEFGGEEPQVDVQVDEKPAFESFDQADAGTKVNGAFDGALKEDAEGVFSDGKSPTAVDGVNGGKKVSAGQEVTGTSAETMTEGEEIDLDEILREMEAEEPVSIGSGAIATENVKLKRSLREHREVIQFLRGKLQEVNMLNHKLLYTNRLFKNFDLRLEQKMKIVETFDRASTPRETKLVYATLAESLKGNSNVRRKRVSAITEGIASKAVASTAPKSTEIISESNDMVARFKKLAGINR